MCGRRRWPHLRSLKAQNTGAMHLRFDRKNKGGVHPRFDHAVKQFISDYRTPVPVMRRLSKPLRVGQSHRRLTRALEPALPNRSPTHSCFCFLRSSVRTCVRFFEHRFDFPTATIPSGGHIRVWESVSSSHYIVQAPLNESCVFSVVLGGHGAT